MDPGKSGTREWTWTDQKAEGTEGRAGYLKLEKLMFVPLDCKLPRRNLKCCSMLVLKTKPTIFPPKHGDSVMNDVAVAQG